MGSPSKVSRVVITGHETPVRVGDARRLAATVYDDKGHLVHNAAVTFSVVGTTPALAVVSNDATGGGASLTPLAPGTVTLIAESRSVSGTATLTVVKADPSPPPPAPTPAITVSVSPTSRTVVQGAAVSVTVTITRTGGYTGAVTIAVTGRPTGVTASALTLGVGVTSGTLTLTAGDAAALGGASLTLTASGSGVASATATAALTVAAPVVVTPPISTGVLPVKIGRSGPGTADTLCLGAVFLGPGRLTAAQFAAGYGVLKIDGVETPFAAEVPDSPCTRHSDASLTMLRAQITRSALAKGAPILASFDVGALRTQALLTMQDTTPALRNVTGATIFDRGAQGWIVSTDPTENCNSTMFGPVRPAAEDRSDAIVQQVIQVYETFAPTTIAHETMEAVNGSPLPWVPTANGIGSGGTAGLAVYEAFAESWDWFARTANTTYWERAVAQWCSWTVGYLAPSGGAAAEQYFTPRSARMAYLFLRDDIGRASLQRGATFLNTGFDSERAMGWATNESVGRFGARAMECLALGMRTEPHLIPYNGLDVFTPDYLTMLFGRALNAPGVALNATWGYQVPAWTTTLAGAGGMRTIQVSFNSINGGTPVHFGFQNALFLNALLEWHDQLGSILPSDLLVLLKQRATDVVQYWMQKFRYVGTCASSFLGERFIYTSDGPESASPALNGFYLRVFYRVARWLAEGGDTTGAHAVRLFADELLRPMTIMLTSPGYDSSPCGTGGNAPDWYYAMPKTWHETMQRLLPDLAERALAIAAGA